MKIAGGITASVVGVIVTAVGLIVAAVGFASPALADDVTGTYAMELASGEEATWIVTPCHTDPEDPPPFIQCIHVAESGGEFEPWHGEAHWGVGFWTMFVERPDAMTCGDEKVPDRVSYSWDAVAHSGWQSFISPGGCGSEPGESVAELFALTKKAPPPPPAQYQPPPGGPPPPAQYQPPPGGPPPPAQYQPPPGGPLPAGPLPAGPLPAEA